MELNPNFREFLELLEKNKVDYLLVGGYAVGFHGFARYTGDIDFFIRVTQRNAEKLVEVFRQFGFASLGLADKDFLGQEIVEIGREPVKIQILCAIDGVKFDDCFDDRVESETAGTVVKIISLERLLQNKAASGRAKDMIDCLELKRIHGIE